MPQEPKSSPLARVIGIAVMLFFFYGGYDAVRDYFSKQSSKKLATLSYRGEWSVGEYRECDSMNLRHMENRKSLALAHLR
jgi:hypothetical protein